MAAGLTGSLMSMEDVVAPIDAREGASKKRGPYKKRVASFGVWRTFRWRKVHEESPSPALLGRHVDSVVVPVVRPARLGWCLRRNRERS